ncbi:competence protein [Winogradskyella sp. PC-19]|uniref:ComEC/Rec2 family competence protein n=1 Tax=unclassified Winogradskyella TaxID=2615021 RepID=UPI000B3D2BED|nr:MULTISPECIES: ComEC/Rec2 family competence protein [unclassified Winogradskyella]ARV10157.1 competence protein [Winogradskyella sp. PC-19]RZN82749.1 MAG: ComEC family competence protein [Winogradskyella sp.]
MKLLNFNIIKLTIYLTLGVLIGFYFNIQPRIILFLYSILFVGFCISFFISKRNKLTLVFGSFVFLTFVSIGVFATKIHDETLQSSHYTNSEDDFKSYNNLSFKVTKRLKPDIYNTKYVAEVLCLNDQKTSGQILINLKKDSIPKTLEIDHIYFTNDRLTEVVKPKNPYQFDYNNYLKQRNIHHQLYLNSDEIIRLKNTSKSINGYADSFRITINNKLEKYGFKPDVLSIINALLLGQRQDISPEIYNSYVNAGVIHILAVSGLHVGIIFIILTWLFKPLHRFKYGKHLIKPVLIILILWCFAFIAGLSPSVTRAVTMFSIITCAQFLKRPTNIYNTISISIFLMQLVNPIYIFDVGFQMSYVAVLAIVSIQPILYKFWEAPNIVFDKFWQILTVTIAAQLGVAPLGLFYFHQFPGLFFVSNLVIIPILGAILGLGILVIALALVDKLPEFAVWGFGFIIETLNTFIAWVAKFENFLLKDISFSFYHVIASYLILISGIYLWKQKTVKSLNYALLSILLFSSVILFNKYKNSTYEFVVFNKSRATIVGEKRNQNLHLTHNFDTTKIKSDKLFKNYKVGNFIKSISIDSLNSIYNIDNDYLLIIDSLGIYNLKQLKPKYVLLTNSPKVNLNRLIDSLRPEYIIADASNHKSYVQRWKATCINKKIPFHSTYEKGAFILRK